MFAIRTNQPPMTKRRRRIKVIIYTVLILVLAVGIPLTINRLMDNKDDSEPSDINTRVASKIEELEGSIKNDTNDGQQEDVETAVPIDQAAEVVEPEIAPAEPSEPPVDGKPVLAPPGYTITIPTKWYYSFVNEGDYQSLNFGSQLFGPDNPYNTNMVNDYYGYVVPASVIPTEAIGALVSADSITTNNQQSVEKKTFTTKLTDVGEITQIIYKFQVSGTDYGLVFYSSSNNSDQLRLIDPVVKTIVLP